MAALTSFRNVALGLACATAGCAPLTFSEPGALDFARYERALIVGDGADYLAEELREFSGFELVTTEPAREVDLVITVGVVVSEETSCDCSCDCEGSCDCDQSFHAVATYAATTPAGELVESGSEEDTSSTWPEAQSDALDEVALHYIRPYRL